MARAMTEIKREHRTKDEIGVAVQSWPWMRVELMA